MPALFVAYALNEYSVPEVRPVTTFVNTPVPAVSAATVVTPVPPIIGSAFVAVGA